MPLFSFSHLIMLAKPVGHRQVRDLSRAMLVAMVTTGWLVLHAGVIFGSQEHGMQFFVSGSLTNDPPISYTKIPEGLTGFAIDLTNAIVQELGGAVHHTGEKDWHSLENNLDKGKVDFLSGIALTLHENQRLELSEPILSLPEVILVRTGGPPGLSMEKLKGKRVAIVSDHTKHASAWRHLSCERLSKNALCNKRCAN